MRKCPVLYRFAFVRNAFARTVPIGTYLRGSSSSTHTSAISGMTTSVRFAVRQQRLPC